MVKKYKIFKLATHGNENVNVVFARVVTQVERESW